MIGTVPISCAIVRKTPAMSPASAAAKTMLRNNVMLAP
jgi:hypothetical protein